MIHHTVTCVIVNRIESNIARESSSGKPFVCSGTYGNMQRLKVTSINVTGAWNVFKHIRHAQWRANEVQTAGGHCGEKTRYCTVSNVRSAVVRGKGREPPFVQFVSETWILWGLHCKQLAAIYKAKPCKHAFINSVDSPTQLCIDIEKVTL